MFIALLAPVRSTTGHGDDYSCLDKQRYRRQDLRGLRNKKLNNFELWTKKKYQQSKKKKITQNKKLISKYIIYQSTQTQSSRQSSENTFASIKINEKVM